MKKWDSIMGTQLERRDGITGSSILVLYTLYIFCFSILHIVEWVQYERQTEGYPSQNIRL